MLVGNTLARRLSADGCPRPSEFEALFAILGHPQVYRARQELWFHSDGQTRAFLIEEGWLYTYKILHGGERQVVDIAVAGDVLGMRELWTPAGDLAVAAATDCVVYPMTAAHLAIIADVAPTVHAAMMQAYASGENLMVDRLVDLGRRSASERLAHFLIELGRRLGLVGLGTGASYRFPLSQTLVADALGLTPIHLNRTIRALRTAGLANWQHQSVRILDMPAMERLAGIESDGTEREIRFDMDDAGSHRSPVTGRSRTH